MPMLLALAFLLFVEQGVDWDIVWSSFYASQLASDMRRKGMEGSIYDFQETSKVVGNLLLS